MRHIITTLLVVGVFAGCKSAESFENYKTKSMATEAKVMVQGMARGVEAAYNNERIGPEGLMAKQALPSPSAGPTPPIGSCCKEPGKQCAPNSEHWNSEPWRSLMFSVDNPHRYSYEYKVTGEDSFTVSAYGDLDCDGEHSTYSLSGRVEGGRVVLDPAIKEDKPLE